MCLIIVQENSKHTLWMRFVKRMDIPEQTTLFYLGKYIKFLDTKHKLKHKHSNATVDLGVSPSKL